MAIQEMPTSPDFSDTRFGLVSNTQTDLTSPIKQSSQILELPGARWRATYALPSMSKVQAVEWISFLLQLRGRAGRFYGFDPSFNPRTPRGSAGSFTLRVAGASQSGATLIIDGADPLESNVFRTGDYLAYDVGSGRQLHAVTADVSADSSGEMTVSIEPPIRTSPDNNALIITTNPSCVMRLVDDEVGWDVSRAQRAGIAFDAIEVF